MIFLRSKSTVLFKGLFFILSFFISCHCSLAEPKKSEKVAVLYSYQNAETYADNKKDFNKAWNNVVESINKTYLSPQYVTNIDKNTKAQDISADLLLFPVALDLSKYEDKLLRQYLKSGRKLVVLTGDGELSGRMKSFLKDNGVPVKNNYESDESILLNHLNSKVLYELPLGSHYTKFKKKNIFSDVAARWGDSENDSIIKVSNLVYFGYPWGQDIQTDNDAKALVYTLDYYWKGITSAYELAISEDDYKKTLDEIFSLKDNAERIIKLGEKLLFNTPRAELMQHLKKGEAHLRDYNADYLLGNFSTARKYASLAKKEFSIVTSLGIPTKNVEVRAIWLDRGTIVKCSGPNELREIIRALSEVGFNVIFFETVNAGFPIYPSKKLPQNPLVKGWDPLKVAVKEAHLHGVELHAWVWTFAVGNQKHNIIVNAPIDYPGPILHSNPDWGMKTNEDSLLIKDQPEMWVSPANEKAQNFLLDLFKEIVVNYEVDGLQLDYIRFPFQKKKQQYGFDEISANAFFKDTGLMPKINGDVNKIWKKWKTDRVSLFVKRASEELKQLRPDLNLSVGVFAMPREKRVNNIQQDWEKWALNKWVDVVYPFYYSYTPFVVSTKLWESKQMTQDKALIIPSFNLRVISDGELSERILASRNAGTLGIALFATAHLDKDKASILTRGPFREKAAHVRYRDPLLNVKRLFEDFTSTISTYINENANGLLVDSKTKKEVEFLIKEIKNEFNDIEEVNMKRIGYSLNILSEKIASLTKLEKYIADEEDNNINYLKVGIERIRSLYQYYHKD